MPENYTNIKDLVIRHLHDLVDSVIDSPRRKVIVHEWIFGVCQHWREFAKIDEQGSEFIPRLSLGIAGIRERFDNGLTKDQVRRELLYVFDISTYCYFEYGARDDLLEKIEQFCKKVDLSMEESILKPHILKFKHYGLILPSINRAITFLKGNQIDPKIMMGLESIDNASSLEKEISCIIQEILNCFLILLKKDLSRFQEIKKEFDQFTSECSKWGYKLLINSEMVKELDRLNQVIYLHHLIEKTHNLCHSSYKVCRKIDFSSFDLSMLERQINTNKIVETIKLEIIDTLLSELNSNPQHYKQIVNKLEEIQRLWKDLIPVFFDRSQKVIIENSKILGQRLINEKLEKERAQTDKLEKINTKKSYVKAIVESIFEDIFKFNPKILIPNKHKNFEVIYRNSGVDFDENEIFGYLFEVLVDLVKREPYTEQKVEDLIKSLIERVSKNGFRINYLEDKYYSFKKTAFLEIDINTIFGKPKIGILVSVFGSDKILQKDNTDINGRIIFENLPRENLTIKIGKNYLNQRKYSLINYYNKHNIKLLPDLFPSKPF